MQASAADVVLIATPMVATGLSKRLLQLQSLVSTEARAAEGEGTSVAAGPRPASSRPGDLTS